MRVNGSPSLKFNQPHCSIGGPLDHSVQGPAVSLKQAISRRLLLVGTPSEQRISHAGGLMKFAGKKLNGFASEAAEKSAIPIVSFSDYPRLKEAYANYVKAAGIYKEALMQLEPGSDDAIKVRQLLIDSHKSCIKTIYLVLDALEAAPGAKSILPYMPWELRACEAIKELDEIKNLSQLRD